jgi:probable HAF family extracellular repeat protein
MALWLALTTLSALPLAAQAQSGITDLGTLGGAYSAAYGISADGTVVVGWADTVSADRAFRWTEAGMVNLGTLGGDSYAYGVSADGAVVVGVSANHAFRWTQAGMVDLGHLGGGVSRANGVSADGAVVVGAADTGSAEHAFRWTNNTMSDLGTLGGNTSRAFGTSADGAVVVGQAHITGSTQTHAFRWTNNVMSDLGTLGGAHSYAYGVSGDGAVVVGYAYTTGDANIHAFRWASSVMSDLGTLGGYASVAYGVSADGTVVVGQASDALDNSRGFRWTQSTGMQSVEDWLRANSVNIPTDITSDARAANSDGSVVVGELESGLAYIARVSPNGGGLITLEEVQQSLGASSAGGSMALSAANTVLNGAHSHPLARRVAAGQKTFWLAGDWGRDDHGSRDGDLGLAELGFGHHFGPAQVNVSLGQTWATQNFELSGRAQTDGTYLLAEALVPVSGNLWATVGGYYHWGEADLRRGYLNASVPDASTGSPDVDTWGLRARLDWDQAWKAASAEFSPYVDLSHTEAKLDAYIETGGGFPAQFDERKDKATELRVGVNAAKPMANGLRLLGTLEATHRFQKTGAHTSGQVIGLFAFDLDGAENKRDWLRAGIGVEGKLAEGKASLYLNLTTKGETPNAWLSVGWQKVF